MLISVNVSILTSNAVIFFFSASSSSSLRSCSSESFLDGSEEETSMEARRYCLPRV